MTTIAIDARLWGTQHSGIGRYVENLIDHLPSRPDLVYHLLVAPAQMHEPKLARFPKSVARFHPYSLLSLFEIPWLLAAIRPRLVHIPHLTVPVFWPGKIVVTIHDLIKHDSRGPQASTRHPVFYWFKYLQYLALSTFAVYRSQHIIVPSNYWRDQLIRRFRVNSTKISVTYEGVTEILRRPSRRRIDLPDQPFVFYVGNAYPHKNLEVLLRAVGLLQGRVLLQISCSRSVFTDRLKLQIAAMGLEKWVKYLGFVSDPDLRTLYEHALAFVFPSKIEGFGLPGLEAMAAGCPVIAADASCLPEIYSRSALYFDPDNPQDLAAKISLILTDTKLRAGLISRGRIHVKKFSWSTCASQTFNIYSQFI